MIFMLGPEGGVTTPGTPPPLYPPLDLLRRVSYPEDRDLTVPLEKFMMPIQYRKLLSQQRWPWGGGGGGGGGGAFGGHHA